MSMVDILVTYGRATVKGMKNAYDLMDKAEKIFGLKCEAEMTNSGRWLVKVDRYGGLK
jgi:hypothetical protein